MQFDHVAVLRPHKLGGSDGVRKGDSYALAMPQGRLVMGVKVDPSGGLQPVWDPLAMLGRALGGREKRQEALRMFYVAFTRAKSTVTFALGKAPGDEEALLSRLRKIFLVPPPAPAVAAAAAPVASASAARASTSASDQRPRWNSTLERSSLSSAWRRSASNSVTWAASASDQVADRPEMPEPTTATRRWP